MREGWRETDSMFKLFNWPKHSGMEPFTIDVESPALLHSITI